MPFIALLLSIVFYVKEKNYSGSILITFVNIIMIVLATYWASWMNIPGENLGGQRGLGYLLSWGIAGGAFVLSLIINGVIYYMSKR